MLSITVLIFIVGLIALYFGANWLVKGASSLAISWNVQPVIVGLTVVAFGTSLPEFVVSFIGTLRGLSDIALGNIVGSNIANIGLILGLSALIFPLSVHMKLVKVETPFMIFVSILLFVVSINKIISRLDSILFVVIFAVYIFYTITISKKEAEDVQKEYKEFLQKRGSVVKDSILLIIGLVVLILGAEILIRSAVSIARAVGISELVIGMTIVAVGTSLPELATSTVAALKKEADISIGNIIGSNIFNILFILGVTGALQPIPVNPEAVKLHMPIMIFFCLLLFIFMGRGGILSRPRGALLLILYAAYVTSLLK